MAKKKQKKLPSDLQRAKKDFERDKKQAERLKALNELKEKKRESLLKTAKSKEETRLKLHAISQANYKLRKQLSKASEKERAKIQNKIIRNNADAGTLRANSGIKKRRSALEIKAEKRSKKAKGVKFEFDFRNIKDAKKTVAKNLKKGVKKVNGKNANELDALVELDNIILQMDAYSSIVVVYDETKGTFNFSIKDSENENENE